MKTEHAVIDASRLPNVVFGTRSIGWLGTAGFIAIEGFTLAIVAASYLDLRQSMHPWPPASDPLPDLGPATIGVGIYIVSLLPAWLLDRAAHRLDRGATIAWLLVLCVFSIGFIALRIADFHALNVRWDADAYGSAAWAVLAFHFTLVVLEAYEVLGLTLIFLVGARKARWLADASDVATYWVFLVLSWLPLYVLTFLGPHFF